MGHGPCGYLTEKKWAIPEKKQMGVVEDILFENAPGIFRFFTLPLEYPDKAKLHP